MTDQVDPARIQGDGTRRCAEPSYPGRTGTTYGPGGRFARGELRMSISEDSRPPDRHAAGGEDADEDPGDDVKSMTEYETRRFATDSSATTSLYRSQVASS